MLRIRKEEGLVSMVEVIVTSIIFTLTFIGVYIALSSSHPKGTLSAEKLNAAYTAKGFLDELRRDVRADTWTTGNLAVGTYNFVYNGYQISYAVTNVTGMPLRRVDLTITY
ncbi:MAG: hypothetical protein H6756_13095 [Candidatus Omnitrophica bacterium]|nr:hypothetical protein [Candidatus Omnitrophota bacterium]